MWIFHQADDSHDMLRLIFFEQKKSKIPFAAVVIGA